MQNEDIYGRGLMRVTGTTTRWLLILFFVLFLSPGIKGQEQNVRQAPPPLRERIFFGGNLGLQIGNYTNIEISPVMGFWLQPRIAVAAGPSFRYMKDPLGRTDVYGGKTYIRLVPVNDINNIIPIGVRLSIFVQAEYEALSFRSDWFSTNAVDPRTTVQTGFVGFGVSQPLGRRGSVDFTVLFVVYYSNYEIYNNPEYRIGFTF